MRQDANELDVLNAFAAKLRKDFDLPDECCFVTTQPLDPDVRPGGEFWLAICLEGGTFDESLQIGGGADQCCEASEISVTILCQDRLDALNVDTALLAKLLPLKRKVLRSLVATDLDVKQSPFLRQLIPVMRSSKPQFDKEHGIGWLQLFFRAEFDWDLTA